MSLIKLYRMKCRDCMKVWSGTARDKTCVYCGKSNVEVRASLA